MGDGGPGDTGTDLREVVGTWAPSPERETARVRGWPVHAMAALLDQDAPPSAVGDPVPPLWHRFSFSPVVARADTGEDGHPVSKGFIPPVAHRRRMAAGGRAVLHRDVRVGELLTRTSSLVASVVRATRTGDLLFTTVRHEYRTGNGDGSSDGLVAVEEEDVAYRSQPPGAPRGSAAVGRDPSGGDRPWRVDAAFGPVELFRFSALTGNSHRIHYDDGWAREVEGFPGLVVHGPLMLLMALELPRRRAAERRVARVDHRFRAPAFTGEPLLAVGGPGADGVGADLAVLREGGDLLVTVSVGWGDR